jgi:hypothetical protein
VLSIPPRAAAAVAGWGSGERQGRQLWRVVQWLSPPHLSHRIGRTARRGEAGHAILLLQPHESAYAEVLTAAGMLLQPSSTPFALASLAKANAPAAANSGRGGEGAGAAEGQGGTRAGAGVAPWRLLSAQASAEGCPDCCRWCWHCRRRLAGALLRVAVRAGQR